jgi:hypothetical protein
MSRQSDLTNPSKAVREPAQLFNLIKLLSMKNIYNGLSEKYNPVKFRPELFSAELKKSSIDGFGDNSIHVILSWKNIGFSDHEIYKVDESYLWKDAEEPFVCIWFFSIDDFIKKYKLPKSLKKEIEKL